MKSSESHHFRMRLAALDSIAESSTYSGFDSIAVPLDVFKELNDAWYLLNTKRDDQFPVLYSGPGRHPDHPAISCIGGACGHDVQCDTHSSNPNQYRGTRGLGLDAPCSCKEKKESND